jgi:hypothetical protein
VCVRVCVCVYVCVRVCVSVHVSDCLSSKLLQLAEFDIFHCVCMCEYLNAL